MSADAWDPPSQAGSQAGDRNSRHSPAESKMPSRMSAPDLAQNDDTDGPVYDFIYDFHNMILLFLLTQ